jgi:hypothetical protein
VKRLRSIALAGLLLAGCNRQAPEPEAEATEVPEELAGGGRSVAIASGIGTPMPDALRCSACSTSATTSPATSR